MKNLVKIVGIIAIIAVIGLIAACGGDGKSTVTTGPSSSTYNWTDDNDNNYNLVITEVAKSLIKTGDYVLTISNTGTVIGISMGTAAAEPGSSTNIIFTPTGVTQPFTIAISPGAGTEMNITIQQGQTITFTEGNSQGDTLITVQVSATTDPVNESGGTGAITTTSGFITNYIGDGIINAYYGIVGDKELTQRKDIGTVDRGRFSFSLGSIPVNNLGPLHQFFNFRSDENSNSGKINIDQTVKAQILIPTLVKSPDTSNGFFEYILMIECNRTTSSQNFFIYVDKATTIKGTQTILNDDDEKRTVEFDMTLLIGWNMMYFSVNDEGVLRYTSYRPAGSAYTWTTHRMYWGENYTLNDDKLTCYLSYWGMGDNYTWQTAGKGTFPIGTWHNDDNDSNWSSEVIEFRDDKTYTYVYTSPNFDYTVNGTWHIESGKIYIKDHFIFN